MIDIPSPPKPMKLEMKREYKEPVVYRPVAKKVEAPKPESPVNNPSPVKQVDSQ